MEVRVALIPEWFNSSGPFGSDLVFEPLVALISPYVRHREESSRMYNPLARPVASWPRGLEGRRRDGWRVKQVVQRSNRLESGGYMEPPPDFLEGVVACLDMFEPVVPIHKKDCACKRTRRVSM